MSEENEVVISGISGRFPECNSTEEFKQKLYNNADLLTVDKRRWSPGKFNFWSVLGSIVYTTWSKKENDLLSSLRLK